MQLQLMTIDWGQGGRVLMWISIKRKKNRPNESVTVQFCRDGESNEHCFHYQTLCSVFEEGESLSCKPQAVTHCHRVLAAAPGCVCELPCTAQREDSELSPS